MGTIRHLKLESSQRERTRKWLAVTCACAAWIGGCYTKRAPAKPPVNFVAAVKPVLPQTSRSELEAPPAVEVEALPVAPQIWPVRQPARPHVAAPPPGRTETKPKEPLIAPEVPSEELKAAQAEAQQNLEQAERNLAMAQGKNLNATQQDIASKARGFAESAREAMKSGDWVRAKNLSSKAQTLAQELAQSF